MSLLCLQRSVNTTQSVKPSNALLPVAQDPRLCRDAARTGLLLASMVAHGHDLHLLFVRNSRDASHFNAA